LPRRPSAVRESSAAREHPSRRRETGSQSSCRPTSPRNGRGRARPPRRLSRLRRRSNRRGRAGSPGPGAAPSPPALSGDEGRRLTKQDCRPRRKARPIDYRALALRCRRSQSRRRPPATRRRSSFAVFSRGAARRASRRVRRRGPSGRVAVTRGDSSTPPRRRRPGSRRSRGRSASAEFLDSIVPSPLGDRASRCRKCESISPASLLSDASRPRPSTERC